jgi:hypothetical protein
VEGSSCGRECERDRETVTGIERALGREEKGSSGGRECDRDTDKEWVCVQRGGEGE